VELLLRAAAIPGTELDARECWTIAIRRLRERRYEAAREWYGRALARPEIRAEDERIVLASVREGMGDALEGLGRWEEALGYHESWRPQTFCGNCAASEDARRLAAVARCKYRVGLADEALDDLWRQSRDVSELLVSDPEAFAHYAEFSVREGRAAELRERFGTLPDPLQQDYARILAAAEAFAARDAAAIVRTVCNHPDDFYDHGVLECCGRMLDDCRPASVAALSEALEGGGFEAVELVGHTRLSELLPALRARLADGPDAKSAEWLAWAIPRLEAVR
jgi:hypothetical protein